jgi:hypothetical protein
MVATPKFSREIHIVIFKWARKMLFEKLYGGCFFDIFDIEDIAEIERV